MSCIKYFLLAIFISATSAFVAQDKITLLKEKLNSSPEDEKAHVMNMLSKALLKKNRSESLEYAESALKLSKESGDIGEEMKANVNKALALSALKKYNEAIDCINTVLKVDREYGNKESEAYNLKLLGDQYSGLRDHSSALNNYKKSYNIYKDLKDERALATLSSALAISMNKSGKAKDAIKWFEISAKHYESVGNKRGEVSAMTQIGTLNANRGDYKKAIKQFEESKVKADKYGLSSMAKSIEKNIEISKQNLESKERNRTDVEIEQEERTAEQIQILQTTTAKSLDEISKLSKEKQILELNKKIQKDAYDREIKEKEEEKAKLEQAKKMAEAESLASKAEKEKADAQNQLLAAENSRQNLMIIGGAVGLALFAILILFILKGYRDKKKANDALVAKNTLIESQKQILEDQKAELEHKSHNIKESLDYAKKIQTSILPPIGGLKDKFSDSFVFFRPKDIVSGDFYWYYEYGSKLYVSVSDCTGHGVPGAFMSIIGNNLIEKAIVEQKIERPADVLKFMSDGINEQLGMTSGASDVKDGMDMTLVCIDRETNKLNFAGARNPLYFYRDGTLEEIKATKMSVGYNSKKAAASFENLEIDLQKGDRLYMFSDGLPDQKGGPKGKKFYYRPFREILQGSGTQPMEFQRDLLEKTIVEWMNGAEQLDDMLVLGIEI